MAKIVGKFPVELEYSELPSLPSELVAGVKLLSGLVGNLGVADGPSNSCAKLEFILPPPMDYGVPVSGAAVMMRTWSVWADPALAVKADHPDPSMRILGENSGASE